MRYGFLHRSHLTSSHPAEGRVSSLRTLIACACSRFRLLLSSNFLASGPLNGFGNPLKRTSQRSTQRSVPSTDDHSIGSAHRSPSMPRLPRRPQPTHCVQLLRLILKALTRSCRGPLPSSRHGQCASIAAILQPERLSCRSGTAGRRSCPAAASQSPRTCCGPSSWRGRECSQC